MKNILIVGCGLIGSSLLRAISHKKIAKKIYVYEKSKSNISKIKRLRLNKCVLNLNDNMMDQIIDIFINLAVKFYVDHIWSNEE